MANAIKVTKKDKYEVLLNIKEVKENEMLVEFINHELELLAKKSKSGSRKPTKKQEENKNIIIPAIIKYLGTTDNATATQITEGIDLGVTVPRVSAQLKKLVAEGKVTREMDTKGRPRFNIAE